MDLGIIGKARSGKTSVFNAVTRGTAQVGAYSAGNEPNVGVVKVPDERVDALVGVFTPKKTTYAEIRWVDYPIDGFGAEGPGRQFVTELAKADALVHVVRAFEDDSVPHPEGSVDAHRDIDALNLELTFVDLGLIEGPVEKAIEDQTYKAFYMHRTSHWLGMDVHDVGNYYDHGEARALAPGYVLTIEPGIYVGVSAEVDPKWRGIGVRIEDDVLVTETGHENLTAAILKAPVEIEARLAAR